MSVSYTHLDVYKRQVGYQVKQALLLKDNEWLGWMSYLIKNKKFYDALSEKKEYQKILKRYYEEYWGD